MCYHIHLIPPRPVSKIRCCVKSLLLWLVLFTIVLLFLVSWLLLMLHRIPWGIQHVNWHLYGIPALILGVLANWVITLDFPYPPNIFLRPQVLGPIRTLTFYFVGLSGLGKIRLSVAKFMGMCLCMSIYVSHAEC